MRWFHLFLDLFDLSALIMTLLSFGLVHRNAKSSIPLPYMLHILLQPSHMKCSDCLENRVETILITSRNPRTRTSNLLFVG